MRQRGLAARGIVQGRCSSDKAAIGGEKVSFTVPVPVPVLVAVDAGGIAIGIPES